MNKRIKLTYSEEFFDWYTGTNEVENDIPTLCHEGVLDWFEIPEDPKTGDTMDLVIKGKPSKTAYRYEATGTRMKITRSNGNIESIYVVEEMVAILPPKGYIHIEFPA